MNFESLLRLRGAWNTFRENHPKFPEFLQAVKNKGLQPGMEIDIAVSYPNDGGSVKTHLKLRPEDLELIQSLSDLN